LKEQVTLNVFPINLPKVLCVTRLASRCIGPRVIVLVRRFTQHPANHMRETLDTFLEYVFVLPLCSVSLQPQPARQGSYRKADTDSVAEVRSWMFGIAGHLVAVSSGLRRTGNDSWNVPQRCRPVHDVVSCPACSDWGSLRANAQRVFCTHLCYHHILLFLCPLRKFHTRQRRWKSQPDEVSSDNLTIHLRKLDTQRKQILGDGSNHLAVPVAVRRLKRVEDELLELTSLQGLGYEACC
jgi:hypothetical protein